MLFGLAFSSHHISAVLVLPALCWHAAAGSRSFLAFFKSLAVPALSSLPVALAFYFSILWIAGTGPLMNWGGVKDLQTLHWHVSGKMYIVCPDLQGPPRSTISKTHTLLQKGCKHTHAQGCKRIANTHDQGSAC